MQATGDMIRFEQKYELADIIKALEFFYTEHANDDAADTAKALAKQLDVMAMDW